MKLVSSRRKIKVFEELAIRYIRHRFHTHTHISQAGNRSIEINDSQQIVITTLKNTIEKTEEKQQHETRLSECTEAVHYRDYTKNRCAIKLVRKKLDRYMLQMQSINKDTQNVAIMWLNNTKQNKTKQNTKTQDEVTITINVRNRFSSVSS